MKCKCVEESHLHSGYCNSEITFADSTPMNDYKTEKKRGINEKGEEIVISYKTIDYDKERCCNDCYDKIKNEAISQMIGYKPKKVIINEEISKDEKIELKKATQGCELCGECVESKKRSDGIHVCYACNNKYPIKD